DVEAPILRVAGVEGDREQPLLAAVLDEVADVEERTVERVAVADNPDPARLLDDEQQLVRARRCRDMHGGLESAHLCEAQPALSGGATAEKRAGGDQRARCRDEGAADRSRPAHQSCTTRYTPPVSEVAYR